MKSGKRSKEEAFLTERLLFEILAYLRASAASTMNPRAEQILNDYRKAVVYKNLDGKRSQLKVSELTGVPQQTISRYAKEFVRAGLASPPSEFYPNYRALFTLEEIGINLVELKRKEAKQKKVEAHPEASNKLNNQGVLECNKRNQES